MVWAALGACLIGSAGCRSPYAADRGTSFGAGAGALAGAAIGGAAGKNPLAGAAIGALTGAVVGNVAGNAIDESEARNRAAIEAQLGRQIQVGSVTVPDVISMSRAGVQDELIVNHIRGNGVAGPITTQDLILLNQEHVSPVVVQAMQAPPPQPVQPVVVQQSAPVIVRQAPPVYVERHYYGRHYCAPPRAGIHVHGRF